MESVHFLPKVGTEELTKTVDQCFGKQIEGTTFDD